MTLNARGENGRFLFFCAWSDPGSRTWGFISDIHKVDSLETCGPLTDDQLKAIGLHTRGGGQIMTNSRSSVHRASQDVRHGVLYSKFVERRPP